MVRVLNEEAGGKQDAGLNDRSSANRRETLQILD
jgi:hypothetical protein